MAKDLYHETVKRALVKDGWLITHDPLWIPYATGDIYIDLGAEDIFAAERGGRKIAIEVKTFGSKSKVTDLERALGQYVLYSDVLTEVEPDRALFIAISAEIFEQVFEQSFGRLVLRNKRVRVVVINLAKEEVVRWLP